MKTAAERAMEMASVAQSEATLNRQQGQALAQRVAVLEQQGRGGRMSPKEPLFTLIESLQAARQVAVSLQNEYRVSARRAGPREALIVEAIARLTAVSGLIGDCIDLLNDFPREPPGEAP